MRYILIPVKDLCRAKQRLSGLLTQEERTRLAWVMLENTLVAAANVANVDRLAVVTLYPPAISLAEKYGMELILETRQSSESASVDFASSELIKRGATSVLRLPIDLPLLKTEDLELILAHQKSCPHVVIAPSRDGGGTNAILRSPPDLFPSHFGPGSFAKHLLEAEKTKAVCEVLHLPRIALDIDEPEDLKELMKLDKDENPLWEVLAEMEIEKKLISDNSRL
ncbi:MAG: 2-phospho-L-lactate guanylyltransferase [Blastocatellia bacterium]|nr:2-phospho-L-lactate guanylyltransferase [Blastocatellia bacterium]